MSQTKSKPKTKLKPKRNRYERPLLSASTILILSGFLIGLTVGRLAADELSPYFLACGLAGCLAFLCLDLTALHRVEEEIEEDKRQQEERLEKHVLSLSSIGFTLPPQKEDSAVLSDEDLKNVLDSVAQFQLTEDRA